MSAVPSQVLIEITEEQEQYILDAFNPAYGQPDWPSELVRDVCRSIYDVLVAS